MPELENREDKMASENAKALKHIFKSRTPTPVEHLSVKIMISRLQTNGTNMSQRL